MAAEGRSDPQMQIGHVLAMDVVGYSKLLIREQTELLRRLGEIVRGSAQVRAADAAGNLIRLPTGDGMTLVFFGNPEAPIKCAVEIAAALKNEADIALRQGIHSGPVDRVIDVNDRPNAAGAGIDLAQRVMDCGDARHILLSKRVADDVAPYPRWNPHLHDLGETEVKHHVRLHLFNLYTDEAGNPAVPSKLQTEASRSGSKIRARFGWRAVAAGALVLLSLGGTVWWLTLHRTKSAPKPALAHSQPAAPEKSIAVLPLENLSDDKKDAFFADGIQDDILTSLAKIADLKVISRTSVMQYRGATRNLRDIGKALGVANILEGSVRRDGNRVLVNAQLIDAEHDRQLWAERYDRRLADSIGLQGELATEIATALQVKLAPREKIRLATKPTSSPEAYVLYLRAREYQNRPTSLLQDDETAVALYSQAIALDPGFALAHARLSATLAHIYPAFEPTAAIKTRARAEAEESLRLDPDLGEGHLARALFLYWTESDYGGALRELQIAAGSLPNNAEVESIVAYIYRRQGRWSEARSGLQNALAHDPRNASIARELMTTNHMMRNWPAAERSGQIAVALAPDRPAVSIERSYIDFWSKGDLAPLRAVLTAIPSSVDPEGEVTWARWDLALLERDFAAAENAVSAGASETMLTPYGTRLSKAYLRGCIALAQREPTHAQPLFEAARLDLEADAVSFPLDANRHAQLGLLYAYLGRKEDALREGRRAVTLLPESKDAYLGPTISGLLAIIYARTGEPDQALALIEHLLAVPQPWVFEGTMTLSDLRLRWQWGPLRNEPRFQKIITGPEPATVYH